MQKIFSFNHFRLLMYKHWNEFRPKLLIYIAIMILAVVFETIVLSFQGQETSFAFYIYDLVLFGGMFTALFFKDWSDKARSVSLMILPTTALEKILVVLFYTVVVFIPLFTIIYPATLFGLLKIFHKENLFMFFDQYRGLSALTAILVYAVAPYVFIQSMIFLGTVWIKKMQFLISFSVFILLLIGSFFLNLKYIGSLLIFRAAMNSVSKQLVFFPIEIHYGDINSAMPNQTMTSSEFITIISAIVLLISAILFYLAAYFKLKEKEV